MHALFPAISWGQDSYSAKLIEGAKKETSLVWYTSTSTEDIKRLFDVFNKKYPFIKTEFYNAGSGALFNRIINEARVGKVFFDLVSIRGVETHQLIKGGFSNLTCRRRAPLIRRDSRTPRDIGWTISMLTM